MHKRGGIIIKKIFLSFTVFFMVFINLVPLVSSAYSDEDTNQYTDFPIASSYYRLKSLSDRLAKNYPDYTVDDVYWFYWYGNDVNSSGNPQSKGYFVAIDKNCTIKENNGIYTFSNYECFYASAETRSAGGSASGSPTNYIDRHFIDIDTTNCIGTLYNVVNDKRTGEVSYNYMNIETNYDGILKSKFGVEVTFSPALQGSLDRIIDDNGISRESNYFNMTVNNKSDTGIQFMMCIHEVGQNIEFVTPDFGSSSNPLFNSYVSDMSAEEQLSYLDKVKDSASTFLVVSPDNWVAGSKDIYDWYYKNIKGSDNNSDDSSVNTSSHPSLSGIVKYVYITEESYYYTDTNTGNRKKFKGNSSWHYIPAGVPCTYSFSWNQINLKADTDYEVSVFAIPNSAGTVILNHSFADDGYSLNFGNAVQVYNSSFSLKNDTKYDSNDNSFGNITYNPEVNALGGLGVGLGIGGAGGVGVGGSGFGGSGGLGGNSSVNVDIPDLTAIKGFTDEDGNDVTDDTTIKQVLSPDYVYPKYRVYDSNDYSSSGGAFQVLSNSFSGFFGLVRSLFGYFPSTYFQMLSFGITALIVVGIIKAVK